jgi:small subunit ribosomal protein S16
MLRIRLSRVGAKRQPTYRIVVANAEAKRDGRVVERIGFYNPRTEPLTFRIEESRALYWLSVGAQPTDAVRRLLVKQGTLERLERLRAGESLDRLVAEHEGAPAPVEEEAPPVSQRVTAAASGAAESVADSVITAAATAVAAAEQALGIAGSAEEEE